MSVQDGSCWPVHVLSMLLSQGGAPGSLSLQPGAMSQPEEEGLEVHKQLMRQMLVCEWRRWSETLSSPSIPSEPVPTQLLV